jgi:TolB-like protein/DNA-binding winged helix-turn-helix (wHTH) protein/Tfp pilus assembly protein PilF
VASKLIKFGVFTLDVSSGELSKQGTRVKLQDQPFRMLCFLVERRGALVTREELRVVVWGETFVEFDLALNTAVRKIRRALGDSADNPRFIETIPKRGYRFIASAEEDAQEPLSSGNIEMVLPRSSVSRPRWWLAGALGIALLAGILAWAGSHRFALGKAIDSLAVLPFANVSGDPGLEYLGDGLAESLIGSLSELRSPRVMSLGTTLSYRGGAVDPRAVGRDLKVSAVLQGKLEKRGEMLIVDAHLADATDGGELWTGHYQRLAVDALDLEQEIAEDVARTLRKPSGEEQSRLSRRSTQNREAYQHYLKGLYNWRQLSSGGAKEAVKQFEQSIGLDPSYALPYVGIAATYQVLNDWVLPPREAVARTRATAEKALDLDATLDQAHTMMGVVRFWYDFDQAGAGKEFRRAIELNPGSDDAHAFYSWYLISNKHFDEGLAESRRALELSPLDLNNQVVLVQNLYYCRRYEEAFQELRAIMAQSPNTWIGHEFLGWVLEASGDLPAAIEELKKAVLLEPNIAEPLASLGRTLAMNGNQPGARQVLAQLEEMSANGHVPPYDLALIYIALNDRERAIRQLQKAYDERSWFLTFLGIDPRFDVVRSDRRVQEVLQKTGLR